MSAIAVADAGQLHSLVLVDRFLDLPSVVAKLRQTNFFVSPEILDAALERDKQRRGT